eukprot:GHVS01023170.1.p1 GENE.GHVS01023170.1~~GHVS01023170.1.p1  ORF type:complete len:683 (-),score=105.72 GHVS01023170.1:450-2498(-)
MSFAPPPPPTASCRQPPSTSSSLRALRQSPFGLPPKPRQNARKGRTATSENQLRLDTFCKRYENPAAGGHTDEPHLAVLEQQPQQPVVQQQSQNLPLQPAQNHQHVQQQLQPMQEQQQRPQSSSQVQHQGSRGGVGRGLPDAREPRSEQRTSTTSIADGARLQRLVERQQKEIESLRNTLDQCVTGLMDCQGRLAAIEKERNEDRREREEEEALRPEGDEDCDRISFVSSKSKPTPIRSPIKTMVESNSFSCSMSFASHAKSATAAGCLGLPIHHEQHATTAREEKSAARGTSSSSSCCAVGQPVEETKVTPRRSNSCAALPRPQVGADAVSRSRSRKNNKRATSARPSVNDSHLRETKRHAGKDVPVLRPGVEGGENAPPVSQGNCTPRPCCSSNGDTQITPVCSSPSAFGPVPSFQNYHKAKKPLPAPTEPNSEVAHKTAMHTLRCCKHSIATASSHNNFAVQNYFQKVEKAITESIQSKTGAVGAKKPEQCAQENKNVDEFSVFGAPPAFIAGDVFTQLDYCRLSDQSKKGHKLLNFVESRGFDIYYGTEMARMVTMQQMSIKAARANFPEATAWGVKANVDEKSPPPANEEFLFSDLVDEYFSSDKLEKNNRLNWRQHPVSDEHKLWVRNYMNMHVSLSSLVYDPEVCFCPTPDPLVKWQWNFKKQPSSSQATGQTRA